jgi:hypothetical protein
MYNDDTELLFPSRVIPHLREVRNKPWRDLVDRASDATGDHIDHLAFILMMVKLDGCNTCNADSFRAMRGCTQCALQNVRRHRGPDSELVKLYNKSHKELAAAGLSK